MVLSIIFAEHKNTQIACGKTRNLEILINAHILIIKLQ